MKKAMQPALADSAQLLPGAFFVIRRHRFQRDTDDSSLFAGLSIYLGMVKFRGSLRHSYEACGDWTRGRRIVRLDLSIDLIH
jgi:hypothetical protein